VGINQKRLVPTWRSDVGVNQRRFIPVWRSRAKCQWGVTWWPSWGVGINDSDMVSPSLEVLCRAISPYIEVLCRGQSETISPCMEVPRKMSMGSYMGAFMESRD